MPIKELEETQEIFGISYEAVNKPKKATFKNLNYSSKQENIIVPTKEVDNDYSFWTYKKNFERQNTITLKESKYKI